MRKKLDTRFPASRIKRIMQTDEDIGKIALAVPLLVSKALELFLQDLCDRTYNVTIKRGAKTMCSSHLKQCVHNFSVFDFLKETVSRVPDVGCSVVVGEDRSSKRRKTVDDEGNVIDEESKRSKRETVHDSRGRGRGRGRGRRRGSHETEWDFSHYNKYEGGPETSPQHDDKPEQGENDFSRTELKERGITGTRVPVRDFDLNIDLDENGLATTNPVSALPTASTITIHEMQQEEYSAWPPFTCIDKVTIDPLHLALIDKRIDEEEDYDNED